MKGKVKISILISLFPVPQLFFCLFVLIFIRLAVLGLTCGTWDLFT